MAHTPTFIGGETRSRAEIFASIQRAVSRLAHSWEMRRQLAHAADLDDHLLRDIGLTRKAINSARRFRH